jgi:hypothetical protein
VSIYETRFWQELIIFSQKNSHTAVWLSKNFFESQKDLKIRYQTVPQGVVIVPSGRMLNQPVSSPSMMLSPSSVAIE